MSTATLSLIGREHNGHVINHRPTDRYIDATAMCSAYGRRWRDYHRLDSSQAFIAALAQRLEQLGQNPASLIQTKEGKGGYIFVHPQIGIHLAQWLDPLFAVMVGEWMEELLTTGKVELAAPPPSPLAVYTTRSIDIWRSLESVPKDHWCVFVESSWLLLQVESALHAVGLAMNQHDLLDGSIGQHWPRFRAGKDWAGERLEYVHRFPAGDSRGDRAAKAYPMVELTHFRIWLQHDYVRCHLADYIRRKYGACELVRCLPTFQARGLNMTLPLSLTSKEDSQ